MIAVLGAGSVVACSLLNDLGGFGGEADSEREDSSTTNDANGEDASVADAGTDVVDAAIFVCDGQALCDTFDDAPLASLWSGAFLEGDASLEITDAGPSVTSPNTLRVALDLADAGTVRRARLIKVFPGSHAGLRCSFDIRLEQSVLNDGLLMAYLDLGATAGYRHEVNFIYGLLSGNVNEVVTNPDGGRIVTDHPVPPVQNKTWYRVTYEVTNNTIRFWNNGTLLVDAPMTDLALNAPTFLMGIVYSTSAGPWDVRFDNAVCETL